MSRQMRLTFAWITILAVAAAGCASGSAETTPSPAGERSRSQEEKGPKAYSDVVTSEAISDEGLFSFHKVDDDYFFEIPDSLLGRDMLLISRLAGVPPGLGGFVSAGVATGR